MAEAKITVLVVDDEAPERKLISDLVDEHDQYEVLASAPNTGIAWSKVMMLDPEVIFIDIGLPDDSGLEFIEKVKNNNPAVNIFVLSPNTPEYRETTMRALELGALDFIEKPDILQKEKRRQELNKQLQSVLKAHARQAAIKRALHGSRVKPAPKKKRFSSVSKQTGTIKRFNNAQYSGRSKLIAIGVSTGGPEALSIMLPMLPKNMGVPIVIVQHMPALFTSALAQRLDSRSDITVIEAGDSMAIQPNTAYLAPGGMQMKLVDNGIGATVQLTDDPPENSCKPSVDYLFRSVAENFNGRVTGVIMTGMGTDGRSGAGLLKKSGAVIIAQDEATSAVFGMPRETINTGVVDVICPLEKIAEEIVRTVKEFSLK